MVQGIIIVQLMLFQLSVVVSVKFRLSITYGAYMVRYNDLEITVNRDLWEACRFLKLEDGVELLLGGASKSSDRKVPKGCRQDGG